MGVYTDTTRQKLIRKAFKSSQECKVYFHKAVNDLRFLFCFDLAMVPDGVILDDAYMQKRAEQLAEEVRGYYTEEYIIDFFLKTWRSYL